jgi:hypothetical protein
MLQTLEIDKDTTENFVKDLLVSKTDMAKAPPAGILFSIGGFKI